MRALISVQPRKFVSAVEAKKFKMIGVVSAVLLAACSSRFEIRPTQLNTSAPKFEIRNKIGVPMLNRRAVQLNSLMVVQMKSSGWDYVHPEWEFSMNPGRYNAISQVRYGVVPAGFEEKVVAKPLAVGVKYLVIGSGAGSNGSAEFSITNGLEAHSP